MTWHRHPGVRSGGQLTVGERAADHMRNTMGSWRFVFGSVAYLAVWILIAETHLAPIDNPQLTILNLVLSCVAALQGAILLIAAKRSDQISSELAMHDYEADCRSRDLLEQQGAQLTALREDVALQRQEMAVLHEIADQFTAFGDRLAALEKQPATDS